PGELVDQVAGEYLSASPGGPVAGQGVGEYAAAGGIVGREPLAQQRGDDTGQGIAHTGRSHGGTAVRADGYARTGPGHEAAVSLQDHDRVEALGQRRSRRE